MKEDTSVGQEDFPIRFSGLILAPIFLIPHYLWMILRLLINDFTSPNKDNTFISIIKAIFLLFCLPLLIPISIFLDFWLLVIMFSSKGIYEALYELFVLLPEKVFNSSETE